MTMPLINVYLSAFIGAMSFSRSWEPGLFTDQRFDEGRDRALELFRCGANLLMGLAMLWLIWVEFRGDSERLSHDEPSRWLAVIAAYYVLRTGWDVVHREPVTMEFRLPFTVGTVLCMACIGWLL